MLSKTIFLILSLTLAGPTLSSPIAHPPPPPPPPAIPVPVPVPAAPVPVPAPAHPKPKAGPKKPLPRTRINDHDDDDDDVLVVVTAPRQAAAASPPPPAAVPDAITTTPGGGVVGVDTQNDVLDGKACTDMTVIFARGTTETGNVGTTTGPPFFAALAQQMGAANVAVQGVDYPADIPGFLAGGSPEGSQTMAALVQQAMSQCPNSKIVISGYSQGAQLVHNAAASLPASTMSKVAGAVLFGDPDDGQAVQGLSDAATLVICHPGDAICAGTASVTPAHLTYSMDAGQAAKFASSL